MIKYRIEVYTNYQNVEGNYRKSIFETECYQEAVNKFNELNEATKAEYEMILSTNELYNHDTCTYKHYFQIEMLSQQFEHGGWRGLSTTVKGGLEKFIGEYKF